MFQYIFRLRVVKCWHQQIIGNDLFERTFTSIKMEGLTGSNFYILLNRALILFFRYASFEVNSIHCHEVDYKSIPKVTKLYLKTFLCIIL